MRNRYKLNKALLLIAFPVSLVHMFHVIFAVQGYGYDDFVFSFIIMAMVWDRLVEGYGE